MGNVVCVVPSEKANSVTVSKDHLLAQLRARCLLAKQLGVQGILDFDEAFANAAKAIKIR